MRGCVECTTWSRKPTPELQNFRSNKFLLPSILSRHGKVMSRLNRYAHVSHILTIIWFTKRTCEDVSTARTQCACVERWFVFRVVMILWPFAVQEEPKECGKVENNFHEMAFCANTFCWEHDIIRIVCTNITNMPCMRVCHSWIRYEDGTSTWYNFCGHNE